VTAAVVHLRLLLLPHQRQQRPQSLLLVLQLQSQGVALPQQALAAGSLEAVEQLLHSHLLCCWVQAHLVLGVVGALALPPLQALGRRSKQGEGVWCGGLKRQAIW